MQQYMNKRSSVPRLAPTTPENGKEKQKKDYKAKGKGGPSNRKQKRKDDAEMGKSEQRKDKPADMGKEEQTKYTRAEMGKVEQRKDTSAEMGKEEQRKDTSAEKGKEERRKVSAENGEEEQRKDDGAKQKAIGETGKEGQRNHEAKGKETTRKHEEEREDEKSSGTDLLSSSSPLQSRSSITCSGSISTTADLAPRRLARHSIPDAEEGEAAVGESSEGRTTPELQRLCSLLEEERRSRIEEEAGRKATDARGGREAVSQLAAKAELLLDTCPHSSQPSSPSPSTTFIPIGDESRERSGSSGPDNSTTPQTRQIGARQASRSLDLEDSAGVVPPLPSSTSLVPERNSLLSVPREERLKISPCSSPRPLPSEAEGEAGGVIPQALSASSPPAAAVQEQQTRIRSNDSNCGGSGICTPGCRRTSSIQERQQQQQREEIVEVCKKCIIEENKEKEKRRVPRSSWEYELFHGFSAERVCYVVGESPRSPKNSHLRSGTWDEDFLAGFPNISLKSKIGNNSVLLTGETAGGAECCYDAEDKHVSSFVSADQQGDCCHSEEPEFPPTASAAVSSSSSSSSSSTETLVSSPRDLQNPGSPFGKRAAAAVEREEEKSFQKLCISSFHKTHGEESLEKRQISSLLQSFVSRIPPPPASCYSNRPSSRIMAPIDPHSYTDSAHPLTKHVSLSLFLDFPAKSISGTATLTLESAHKGEIFLDTRDLTIESAEDPHQKKSLKFFLEKADVIKGSLLRVVLEQEVSVFSVTFKTSTSASALQWLDPSQTAGQKLPYVFTQCQAIHARSIFPCQDTPMARIKYSADVNVPSELSVVMSAAHVGRKSSDSDKSRAIESFVMEQPIPPYLFALAAGDIVSEEVGPRTRIYAEPSEVKAAAYEFANTEETVKKAEALFGPYDWERFDLLVMPPSFPYGGMENPRMVFLTPTIIVGDRSGVEVVAHELAHSWTGNLISNSTANDFWLNEGFTTYAERRIVEAQDGVERVALHIGLGWQGLKEEVERFKERPEMTKLKMNLEGVDPDEIYSKIPYEKGFQFLRRLEFQVGRPTFDEFLKKYIAKFRFQSIDTETFLVFLKENLPKIEEQVDLQTWIHGTGIPDDAIRPKAGILERVQSLADGFQSGAKPHAVETDSWQAQEWMLYIERLPNKLRADQIVELEELYHFSDSANWEIKIGILTIGANSGYQPFYPKIVTALHNVGRMKYLKPLYQGLLLEGSSQGKELAIKVFSEAKNKYHPIAQVVIQGLLTKYTSS